MRSLLCLLAVWMSGVDAWTVPSSGRSREAISRVEPGLSAELKDKGLEFGSPIFIRIFKEESELELWVQGSEHYELFRSYPVCAWSGDLGPKLVEGDGQSPEGFYYINAPRMNPSSTFHLSMNLGFPNSYDQIQGRTGSFLMVHGDCVSIGCYAMTDRGIEEIWALADASLRGGQSLFRVHIFPFRMTQEKLDLHKDSDWYSFWLNLKEGYDLFESSFIPPKPTVVEKTYFFEPQ
jgi:murein L,D-transpeptidase YafK